MINQKFIKNLGYTGDASLGEDVTSDASEVKIQTTYNYYVHKEPMFIVKPLGFPEENSTDVDEEALKELSKSNYQSVLTPVF